MHSSVTTAGGLAHVRATQPLTWMTRRPSRRSQLELWWPLIARGIGIGIGLGQMVAGFLGRSPDPSILAFAAGLIVAPNIAGVQQRRNGKRDEDDD